MTHPTAQVAPRPAVPIAPAFPIRLGILLAIAVGWLEILIRFAIHLIRGHPIDVGPHVLWMTPVANLLWFGVTGLALALAARLWPRLARPALVLGLLAFPAILSLLLLNTKFFDSANVVLAAGLAVQAGTLGARHLPALERLARRGAVMAVALLAAATLGLLGWLAGRERWALAHLPSARDGAPNVLLIVLDTVRDFNVSLAGYERRTTPALERWAAEGVHFEHAFAPAPWTLPSHATMFTGRWPHELTTTLKTPLDDRYPTLAEALRAAGYATGGFAANLSYVTWQFGLDRGFLHFEDFPVTKRTLFVASSLGRWLWAHGTVRRLAGDYDLPDRKSAAMVGDGFLGWQASLGRRPFFAFLNLFDAHFPYLPPAPYDTLFGPRPAPIFRGEELKFGDLTPTETVRMMGAYDGGIAYMDREIDVILHELARRGVLDNTLVIITSDHGEHWGDHRRLSHGNSVYRQLLQVPLVVRFPARVPRGTVVRDPVSLRDLPATVLHLVGVENGGRFPGGVLTAVIEGAGDAPATSPVLSSNSSLGAPAATSLIADGLHYIRDAKGREELYDFQRDPRDTLDLAARPEMGATLARLRAAVDSLTAGQAPRAAIR